MPPLRPFLCCVGWLALSACDAPAAASVLLDLGEFTTSEFWGLRSPQATLDVLDASADGDGASLAVDVRTASGEFIRVQSPLPVPCDPSGGCGVQLRVRPGLTSFALQVSAEDRCGTRGMIFELREEEVELQRFQTAFVGLDDATFAFDDDDDGIMNVLEDATCGRYDMKDGAAPPQKCRDVTDPCCEEVSALEGHEVAFAGGPFVDVDSNPTDVGPFALDATEVTWRQLARCVAAGVCLADRPEHPARLALASAAPREPVVGLTPRDAETLCSFYGKRLPTDAEWDYAAAHRDGTDARARYPWDGDAVDVGCVTDTGQVSANYDRSGASCPRAPVAVGSYPTSQAARGAGVPLVDLAGNVAEWTLIADAAAPAIPELPPGTVAAVLRGGGARSPLPLLENDLSVAARLPASGEIEGWREAIVRLSQTAGFRCARDVTDGNVAPPFPEEPACGGGE